MDEKATIGALAALAQEHRLKVFRLLVRTGPQGLAAGEIARRLGVPASTMSSHLAQLERAGLLRSRRDQRHILYGIDVDGIGRLLTFLIEDCCGGRPELCGPAFCALDREAAPDAPPGRGERDAAQRPNLEKTP
jgi:DNA-binding transcriptional ArsR family regulator